MLSGLQGYFNSYNVFFILQEIVILLCLQHNLTKYYSIHKGHSAADYFIDVLTFKTYVLLYNYNNKMASHA